MGKIQKVTAKRNGKKSVTNPKDPQILKRVSIVNSLSAQKLLSIVNLLSTPNSNSLSDRHPADSKSVSGMYCISIWWCWNFVDFDH